jgi:hypothetical protein
MPLRLFSTLLASVTMPAVSPGMFLFLRCANQPTLRVVVVQRFVHPLRSPRGDAAAPPACFVMCPSRRRFPLDSLRSLFTGIVVFALGTLSDLWLQRQGGSRSVALIDDALVGPSAGLLVFF